MPNTLQDKVVIVTGSSGGIGWAIAQAAHGEGAKVLLHGSRKDALKANASKLGDNVDWIAADLTDPASPSRIVNAALEAFGRLDGLVNNAGVFPRSDLTSTTPEIFDRIFAINTRAPLLLCQAAVGVFREQGSRGSIVNIGSINAHCGQSDLLPYSMSKGALQTMTRNLGDALGQEGIRVNQLNVGWTYTETEHKAQMAEGRPENWLELVPPVFAPTGTILRPEQVAPHAIFWLSDQSWPVNGQVYEVEQYPLIGRSNIQDS